MAARLAPKEVVIISSRRSRSLVVAISSLALFLILSYELGYLGVTGLVIAILGGASLGLLESTGERRNLRITFSSRAWRVCRIVLAICAAVVLAFTGELIADALGVAIAILLVGDLVTAWASSSNDRSINQTLIRQITLSFAAGVAVFLLCLAPLALLHLETSSVSRFLAVFLLGTCIAVESNRGRQGDQKTVRLDEETGAISTLLVAIAVALYLRAFSTFPEIPGWDIYSHMLDIRFIQYFGGIRSLFIPYPVTFHIGLAALGDILSVDVFQFFWYGILLTIPVFSILLYLVYLDLGAAPTTAAIGSIISTFVSGFAQSLGPNYVVPSTLGLVLAIAAILLLRKAGPKPRNLVPGILVLLCSALVYPYAAGILSPVFYYVLWGKSSGLKRILPHPLVTIPAAFALLTYGAKVLGTGQGPETVSRVPFLINAYTEVGLLLLLGSVIGALISRKPPILGLDWSFSRFLALYIGMLFLAFLVPNTLSIRLELFMRVFAGFFIVLPLGVLLASRFNRVGIISVIVILLLVLQPLPFPYGTDIKSYSQVGSYTNISVNEYQATQWVKQNIPLQAGILTDPASAALVEGLSFRYGSDSIRSNLTAVLAFLAQAQVLRKDSFYFDQNHSTNNLLNPGTNDSGVSLSLRSSPVVEIQNTNFTGEYKLFGSNAVGQSFVPTGSILYGINFSMRVVGSLAQAGNVLLEILAVENSTDIGTLSIANGTTSYAQLDENFESVNFNLNPTRVVPGRTYLAVLTLSTPSGDLSNYLGIQGDARDVYPGGTTYFRAGENGQWIVGAGDLVFVVLSPPVPVVNPTVVFGHTYVSVACTLMPSQVLEVSNNGSAKLDGVVVSMVLTDGPIRVSRGNNQIQLNAIMAEGVTLTASWRESIGGTAPLAQVEANLSNELATSTRGVARSYEYVLISDRTAIWINGGDPNAYEYVPVSTIASFPGLAKFTNSKDYTLVFSNPSVEIFEINAPN